MRQFSIALVLLGALGLADAGVASASGWSIQQTPSPPGANESNLGGVSCTSASACTAVGGWSYSNGITEVGSALAEYWDGTKWSIQQIPNPPNGNLTNLRDISCSAASACTAIGDYELIDSNFRDLANGVTLAERWNGATWSPEQTADPPASYMISVSCPSASVCIAVGDGPLYKNAVAERWDGTTWSILQVPNPTGAEFVDLRSVSCTSASACTAVGDYGFRNRHPNRTFAERWDGTKWSVQHTPNVKGARVSLLYGVSCTSASACTAVGDSDKGALAERWNGAKWSIQHTPTRRYSNLFGVSCTSKSACTAVGTDGFARTWAERWDGTKWSIQHTPNPTGAKGPDLDSVSCAPASACIAIGSTGDGTLVERWKRG